MGEIRIEGVNMDALIEQAAGQIAIKTAEKHFNEALTKMNIEIDFISFIMEYLTASDSAFSDEEMADIEDMKNTLNEMKSNRDDMIAFWKEQCDVVGVEYPDSIKNM